MLAAGHTTPGSLRRSHARTFAGPQRGCARRTARHAAAISAHSECGRRRGARERSGQTRYTLQTIARMPLVTDTPAHPEATAKHGKRLLAGLDRHHKTQPFLHRTGLLPNHRQDPPRRSEDLLPMSPVYSVTHVAGLDPHPGPLPAGERRIHGVEPSLFSPLPLARGAGGGWRPGQVGKCSKMSGPTPVFPGTPGLP